MWTGEPRDRVVRRRGALYDCGPVVTGRGRAADEARNAEGRARRTARGGERRPRAGGGCRGCGGDDAGGDRRLGGGGAGARIAGRRGRCRRGRDLPVRSVGLRGDPAARLSVGGRQRLSQPCRAGPQGARRGDAEESLRGPADVPGRLGFDDRPHRRHRARRRGVGHRHGGRGLRHPRRRADGGDAGRRARPYQAGRNPQRREPPQPDPGRARQGFRLSPGQADDGVLPGGGDAGLARPGMGRDQDDARHGGLAQRRPAGAPECRHRPLLRYPDADRACRQEPPPRGGDDPRHRHHLQPRPRHGLGLPRRGSGHRDHRARRAEDAVHALRRPGAHRDARRRRAIRCSGRSTSGWSNTRAPARSQALAPSSARISST